MKHDPEVSREMEQSLTNMLKDELRLNEEEASSEKTATCRLGAVGG